MSYKRSHWPLGVSALSGVVFWETNQQRLRNIAMTSTKCEESSIAWYSFHLFVLKDWLAVQRIDRRAFSAALPQAEAEGQAATDSLPPSALSWHWIGTKEGGCRKSRGVSRQSCAPQDGKASACSIQAEPAATPLSPIEKTCGHLPPISLDKSFIKSSGE